MTHPDVVNEMVPAPESPQKQLEHLLRRLEQLEREHQALREQKKLADAKAERLEKENQELRRRLDKFIRMYFGRTRSEAISADQLELALQGLGTVLSQAVQHIAPLERPLRQVGQRHPRRALDDMRLEERETCIEPEEVKADPEGWTRLGEERTTQLDYEPGRLFRHVIIRPRYVRKEQFAIAPLPAQPIDKGMVGAGLLAWLLMSKYSDHLPLYRMAAMLHRQHGVQIPRNTLSDWVGQASELLRPIYLALLQRLRRKSYLQVDETPVRYLDPEAKGRSQQGYFWVYADPVGKEVLLQWSQGRAHDAPREFLGDYRGILQVDGYSAYTVLFKASRGALTIAHCWAHVRREIREASSQAPRAAAWLLRQIQLMYQIEKQLRDTKAGAGLRQVVRSSQTVMVVERLFKAMVRLRARQLPGAGMAKALDYALARQDGLRRFLSDGRLEIDSNFVENAIRPSAVGRKNWLFVGHPDAGDRAAIFYSLMASCRTHGINPWNYLKDVLSRLPSAKITEIESFIPAEWAKARSRIR